MYYEDLMEDVVKEDTMDLKNILNIKNYEKYTVPFNDYWTDNKYYKRITIENYGTGSQGSKIKNAVTGSYYGNNITVGSVYEDILFKVIESSGRNGRQNPLMLYYDTPQQYENHHFTKVSENVKQRWLERSTNVKLIK
jgi:hypothetical protein